MEAAFNESPAPMASTEDLASCSVETVRPVAPERHRPSSAASGETLTNDDAENTATAHASFSTNCSSEFPRLSPSRGLSSDFVCSSLSRKCVE